MYARPLSATAADPALLHTAAHAHRDAVGDGMWSDVVACMQDALAMRARLESHPALVEMIAKVCLMTHSCCCCCCCSPVCPLTFTNSLTSNRLALGLLLAAVCVVQSCGARCGCCICTGRTRSPALPCLARVLHLALTCIVDGMAAACNRAALCADDQQEAGGAAVGHEGAVHQILPVVLLYPIPRLWHVGGRAEGVVGGAVPAVVWPCHARPVAEHRADVCMTVHAA